jgi:hypothetical protein
MTEKDDTTPGGDGVSTGDTSSGAGDASGGSVDTTDEPGLTREEWEHLPADPKLEGDFGYRLGEWEEYSTLDGSEALMFLPNDEDLLREDAFVVADEESLADLGRWY